MPVETCLADHLAGNAMQINEPFEKRSACLKTVPMWRSTRNTKERIVLAVSAILFSCMPRMVLAGDHIQVTQEFLVERDTEARTNALVMTKDGGVVLAGIGAGRSPWAVKVARDGTVQWRHEADVSVWLAKNEWPTGEYTGAVALSNGGVVLCGAERMSPKNSRRLAAGLTFLDKDGRVVGRQWFYPKRDDALGVLSLSCTLASDGLLLRGEVRRVDLKENRPVSHAYHWLATIRPQGEIVWEQLVPAMGDLFGAQITSSEEIFLAAPWVLRHSDSEPAEPETKLVRIDKEGNILNEAFVPGSFLFARSAVPDRRILLISHAMTDDLSEYELDEQLKTERSMHGDSGRFYTNEAHRLHNADLFLIGNMGNWNNAMLWVSSDLSKHEAIDLGPQKRSNGGMHAVPTGVPGEYVVEGGTTATNSSDNVQTGVILRFVRIK